MRSFLTLFLSGSSQGNLSTSDHLSFYSVPAPRFMPRWSWYRLFVSLCGVLIESKQIRPWGFPALRHDKRWFHPYNHLHRSTVTNMPMSRRWFWKQVRPVECWPSDSNCTHDFLRIGCGVEYLYLVSSGVNCQRWSWKARCKGNARTYFCFINGTAPNLFRVSILQSSKCRIS